jgi:outer membrane protein OmpA-like peptidoglycan-associated protein
MSSQSRRHHNRGLAVLSATVAFLCMLATLSAAQDRPAPKWELFAGYSFVYPGTDVHGLLPGGVVPVNSRVESNPGGVAGSVTYNFNRWFGLTADGSGNWGSGENGVAMRIDDAAFYSASLGPKLTFRRHHFSPFLEALVGWQSLDSDVFQSDNQLGFMAGGGLDLNVSKHFALRLLRADFVLSNHQYGPSSIVPDSDVRGVRLESGIVFRFGGKRAETPPAAVCSIQPAEIFAGEAVIATAAGSNFNPKRTVVYSWSGSGVKPGETGASTQIDTTGLHSGSYQVTARLSDGSSSGEASCSDRFTVKEQHPPTISCAADPPSVASGTATITSTASSPDGRTLTYTYAASAGSIAGNTSAAALDTAGAQPGTITVTCNVADDRNPPLTASSLTTVILQAPPPAPPLPDVAAIEKRLALHSVYFATAKPTLDNPEAGLLASQEKTLTALASDFLIYLQVKPDARLTLNGHADRRGSVEYNQALSQRRVDRVKGFLTALGVPAANIQTEAFGETENLTDSQVKAAVERNPELSAEDRQKVLDNMRTIILASNRRVDITLSNVGQVSQQSTREYPFNAADSLTLLQEKETKKPIPPAARKKTTPKSQQ